MSLSDPYNRQITYLRISVTTRCDQHCIYCGDGYGKDPHNLLSDERITAVCQTAADLGINKIRLTGGEPLLRPGICGLIKNIAGINGIETIALTTNGSQLSEYAEPLYHAGLKRLNISLDALDPDLYHQITGSRIQPVLDGIETSCHTGFESIKINMVMIPRKNQHEEPALQAFCRKRGIQLQRIAHFDLADYQPPADDNPCERPRDCSLCDRIRITADGRLKPCLMSDNEISINWDDPAASIIQAVAAKPRQGEACRSRSMQQIGG